MKKLMCERNVDKTRKYWKNKILLTNWIQVMYFFHHKYFWYLGPKAEMK